MIKNLASLYIYEINKNIIFADNEQVKIVFLGDIHTSEEAGCDFDGPSGTKKIYNIDELLQQWIIYNEKNNIKTDLYAEVHFTKSNQRFVITEGSPLQLLPSNIPCFTKDKNCYKNVKLHYVDIRSIDMDGIRTSLDPFDMSTLKYLAMHRRIAYHKIIDIINHIKSDYIHLLNFLLLPLDFNKIKDFIALDKAYSNVFYNINKHVVVRDDRKMFRAAAEIYKLRKINLALSTKLLKFIFFKARVYMSTIDFSEEIETLRLMAFSNEAAFVKDTLTSVDNKLLKVGGLVMDAYTLARMFCQIHESEEVIVYAGTSHIAIYVDFLQSLLLTPLLAIDNKDRCIEHADLANYIDFDKLYD